MFWNISTWQILTEEFVPCKVEKGRSRGKTADISARTKLWRNLTPRAVSLGKGKAWGHMRLLESSDPMCLY